jgi:hypothetical protein
MNIKRRHAYNTMVYPKLTVTRYNIMDIKGDKRHALQYYSLSRANFTDRASTIS